MSDAPKTEGSKGQRIAVPVVGGRLAQHFGHCAEFAIFTTDGDGKQIDKSESVASPPHEPGRLPGWLGDLGVDVIIAGGMGRRAQELFRQHGIEVVVGAGASEPQDIVRYYLDGSLSVGRNLCDH